MGNVYIFRIGELGDTLMALPAISEIKELHKNQDLILITNKSSRITAWDVLKHTEYFKGVLFYELSDIKNILSIARIIRSGKKNILYYLPPERTKKQAIRDYIFLKILCGIDKVIGIKESVDKKIKRNKKGDLIYLDRESIRLLKLAFKNHNYDNKLKFPLLHPSIEVYKKVATLLREIPKDGILISVGHGSKMPAKKWPIERFMELCNRLLNYDDKIYILLLGGKENFESGELLRYCSEKRILNFAGKTNIIESAAIVEKCFLFIGNDTGTMHLAASMGIPCVGIFSARENPGKWDPYGTNNVILRKDVDCAGCFLEECLANEMKCIKMITVDEVFETIIGFLNKTKSS